MPLLIGKMVAARLPMTPRFVTDAWVDGDAEALKSAQELMVAWVDAWVMKGFVPDDILAIVGDIATMTAFPSIGELTALATPVRDARRGRSAIEQTRRQHLTDARALMPSSREDRLAYLRSRMTTMDEEYTMHLKRRQMDREPSAANTAGNLREVSCGVFDD
jgi:hypothetical protein